MKRIAVLTSGGDAPGMNAAVRAVVRKAIKVLSFNQLLTLSLQLLKDNLLVSNNLKNTISKVSLLSVVTVLITVLCA